MVGRTIRATIPFASTALAICLGLVLSFGGAFADDHDATASKPAGSTQSLWLTDSSTFTKFGPGKLRKSAAPGADVKFQGRLYPGGVTVDRPGNIWGTLEIGGGPIDHGWIFELTPSQIKRLTTHGQVTPKVSIFDSGTAFFRPTYIQLDNFGDVWVSASDDSGGAELIEYSPDQFGVAVSPDPKVVIHLSDAQYLREFRFDRSGNLWVAVDFPISSGIAKLMPEQLTTSGTPVPVLIVGVRTQAFTFDQNDNLWIHQIGSGQPDELKLFAATDLTGTGSVLPNPIVTIDAQRLPNGDLTFDSVSSLAVDNSGALWVASPTAGIYSQGQISKFSVDQIGISGDPIPLVTLRSNAKGRNFNRPSNLAFSPPSF